MPPLPRGTASVTTLLLAGMLALTGPVTVQAQEDAAPEAAPAEPAAKPKPRPRKPAPKKEEPKEATSAAPSGTVLEPAAASGSAQWPAGASSVSESYGDWTMNCNRAEARTDCVIIQSQGDRIGAPAGTRRRRSADGAAAPPARSCRASLPGSGPVRRGWRGP